MSDLVLADTSCLIVLKKIGRIALLKDIFSKITITPVVQKEFGESLPEWIQVETIRDETRQRILQLDLDKGEASAITLALENENSLLLIDEKKGRKLAHELGLKLLGTLGVLIRAKEMGIIHSLVDEIEKLKKVDFRMSEQLIQRVIEKYD